MFFAEILEGSKATDSEPESGAALAERMPGSFESSLTSFFVTDLSRPGTWKVETEAGVAFAAFPAEGQPVSARDRQGASARARTGIRWKKERVFMMVVGEYGKRYRFIFAPSTSRTR